MTKLERAAGSLTPRDVAVPVGLIIVFAVTRYLIALSLQLESVAFIANDVGYYAFFLNKLEMGETGIMLEYPVPAVWIMQFIYWLGGGMQTWTTTYVVCFVLLDFLVAALLYRRRNAAAALFWILFTGAQGAVLWYRFDLLPAALVAIACLYAMRFPKVAGGAIGLGAAIKLWPALLIGPLLAPNPVRRTGGRSRLIGFVVAGFGLAAASLLTHGWTRSASPITWQSERGLQIESVPATPLMFLRTFTHNESWLIDISEYNALEIVTGPGIDALLNVSTALTAASILLAVVLSWRLIRNFSLEDSRLHEAMLLAVLAILLATVVANKTLSPQYIVWIAGPVAALLVIQRSGWLKRHIIVMAVAMVVIGGLTQFTYPWGAYGVMAIPQGSGPETSVLVLRNVMLVALTVHALVLAWRTGRRPTS